jgi:hypothetical protein
VAELFLNFHLFGVCIGMACYGFLAAVVYRRLYPAPDDPFGVTVYALTLAAGLAFQLPGDIMSVTLGYLQLLVPVVVLQALSHIRDTVFVGSRGDRYRQQTTERW